MNYRFWKYETQKKHNQILLPSCPFSLSDHLFYQISYQNLRVLLTVLLWLVCLFAFVITMVENSKVSSMKNIYQMVMAERHIHYTVNFNIKRILCGRQTSTYSQHVTSGINNVKLSTNKFVLNAKFPEALQSFVPQYYIVRGVVRWNERPCKVGAPKLGLGEVNLQSTCLLFVTIWCIYLVNK